LIIVRLAVFGLWVMQTEGGQAKSKKSKKS